MEAPALLQEVFKVRRSIGDPVSADFVYVETLPVTVTEKDTSAFTTGDGKYWFDDGMEMQQYKLKFSDSYIFGLLKGMSRIKASIRLIDNLIASIDPTDYITSGNAGGQSVSFLSLQDILAFYNALRDRLLEEEAEEEGMNSGLMLHTKRRPVGGVLEDYE